MASTELITVHFRPTDAMPTYRGTFAWGDGNKDVICKGPGQIEVTAEKAEDLIATWPDNFSRGPTEEKKAVTPKKNKAMTSDKNKSG